MALTLVAGPGCDATKEPYLDGELEAGDVVISVGRIVKALAPAAAAVPSANPPVLQTALALRTAAIKLAREKSMSGFVLTSNGNRADLDRLRDMAGADGIAVLAFTELEACAAIRALVPAGARREACELGIRARWFGRYVKAPGDRLIRPPTEDREVLMMDEFETAGGSSIAVEIRESADGQRLVGTLLQEGRAASVRKELFAPFSGVWGADGIAIRTEHRGREVTRAVPVRGPDGSISISAPATPEIRAAFASGKRYLSAEFQALAETRTAGGIRELQKAYIGAAALVRSPEYVQARAELRAKSARRRPWL